MDNKKILMIGGMAIVILALVVALVYLLRSPAIGPLNGEPGGETGLPTSDTRSEVSGDVTVPELGSETGDGSIAVPVGVTDAAPGATAQLRTFNIKAEGGKFNPSTVIVNEGDTVHINFTAVDGTYDMTLPDYGLKQTATEGQTKIFEFQATNDGQYTYYCESCGGLNSSAKGFIIIKPSTTGGTTPPAVAPAPEEPEV
jgi:plastocyanin